MLCWSSQKNILSKFIFVVISRCVARHSFLANSVFLNQYTQLEKYLLYVHSSICKHQLTLQIALSLFWDYLLWESPFGGAPLLLDRITYSRTRLCPLWAVWVARRLAKRSAVCSWPGNISCGTQAVFRTRRARRIRSTKWLNRKYVWMVSFVFSYTLKNSLTVDSIFSGAEEADYNSNEGGPNWELFAPRGNRFFLPGSLGPAWQGATTTAATETDLEKMIDFKKDVNYINVLQWYILY